MQHFVMRGFAMDGYLLMVRMNLDDVPVRFFSNLAEAKEFVDANIIDGEPTIEFQDRIKSMAAAIDFDTSDLVRCDVLRIIDGLPTEVAYSEAFTFA
jgi:hypothetical protein